jgi:hypothetical protein
MVALAVLVDHREVSRMVLQLREAQVRLEVSAEQCLWEDWSAEME